MTTTTINEIVREVLERNINDTFAELHSEYDTKSGDITPLQSFQLEQLLDKLSELMTEQITQNL